MFYPPEDVARGEPARHLAEAAAAGNVEYEGWRVRQDGSRFWADVVITAIVSLADALELRTVAEGIETASQLAAVTGLGCALGQGFFLGRPAPALARS